MARPLVDLSNPEERHRLGKLHVLLYEREREGVKDTVVLLHKELEEGGSLEMRMDPDRMEATLKRGEELFAPYANLKGTLKREVGSMEHGTWNVRYFVRALAGRPAEMALAIDQQQQNSRQFITVGLDDFRAATGFAQAFERKKGHERQYFHSVRCLGLNEEGTAARLIVTQHSTNLKAARDYAITERWRDYGEVVWNQPTRRKFGDEPGYTFSASIAEVLRYAPKLGIEIDYFKLERQRRTPTLLLGVWCEQNVHPEPGLLVTFDPEGRDVNSRQATAYRVVPKGTEVPSGPGKHGIPVVIELDQNWPPKQNRLLCALPHIKAGPEHAKAVHPPLLLDLFEQVGRVHRQENQHRRADQLHRIQEMTQKYIEQGRQSHLQEKPKPPGHKL